MITVARSQSTFSFELRSSFVLGSDSRSLRLRLYRNRLLTPKFDELKLQGLFLRNAREFYKTGKVSSAPLLRRLELDSIADDATHASSLPPPPRPGYFFFRLDRR